MGLVLIYGFFPDHRTDIGRSAHRDWYLEALKQFVGRCVLAVGVGGPPSVGRGMGRKTEEDRKESSRYVKERGC